MIKTILASLTGYGSDRTVLDAAVAAARLDGAHIQCLHTRIGAAQAAALAGYTAPEHRLDLHKVSQQIAAEQAERLHHAKAAFAEACERHALAIKEVPSGDAPSIVWRDVETLLNETLHEARYHDLVVMAREKEVSAERIESVLMQSGRPLLLAPPKPVTVIGRKVAVAWKAGSESARAMTAASAILSRAEHVFILSVSEDKAGDDTDRYSAEHLAKQLKWHGVTAQLRMEYSPAGPASAALKQMAYNCDADLLMMGAYGHSRVREFVFGGVTRDILNDCAIPVLLVR
jgi:nucleotide-binding universal stress UspA family protein